MEEFIEYELVKKRYTGERAKSVKAHAAHGVGYVILEESKDYCIAAFKRPVIGARPYDMQLLTTSEENYVKKKLYVHEDEDNDFTGTP